MVCVRAGESEMNIIGNSFAFFRPFMESYDPELLKQYDDFSQWIDNYRPKTKCQQLTANTLSVIHAGRGQFAMLFALVHPDIEVHAYTDDPDDAALIAACEPMPENLHVHDCLDEQEAIQAASGTDIINLFWNFKSKSFIKLF